MKLKAFLPEAWIQFRTLFRKFVKKTFVGTLAEWDALTLAEKTQYDLADFTDDTASGVPIISDAVAEGDMNPVTSNAVFNATKLDILYERNVPDGTYGAETFNLSNDMSNYHLIVLAIQQGAETGNYRTFFYVVRSGFDQVFEGVDPWELFDNTHNVIKLYRRIRASSGTQVATTTCYASVNGASGVEDNRFMVLYGIYGVK